MLRSIRPNSRVAIASSPSTQPMGERSAPAALPRRMPQPHEPTPPSGHPRLAACRSQSVQASAGSGGQLTSDCTASQPWARNSCSWAWLPIPSATSRNCEIVTELDHRCREQRAAGVLGDAGEQHPRELDRRQWRIAQYAQRGRAAAESVNRDTHAQGPKRVQLLAGVAQLVQQQTLVDLDLQPVRRDIGSLRDGLRAAARARSMRAGVATGAARPRAVEAGRRPAIGPPDGRRPRSTSP